MLKAYKFRMYPSNEQLILLNKTFGCSRFIYNHFLNIKINEYKETDTSRTTYEYIKELSSMYNEYPWLKEVDSTVLRTALFDLEDAYKRMYLKQNNSPKFKSKYSKQSFRTSNITSSYKDKIYNNIKLDMKNKIITLPKLKEIKIRGYRNLSNIYGLIKNVTVSKEAGNRYYVSVLVEQEEIITEVNINTKIIGLDLGTKELITTSDGETYENIKTITKYEKRIIKIQKQLSKKVKGSNNYQKTKQKLASVYRKIRNTRKFYLHNISKKIVKENSIIVAESLKIKNMIKNHKLAKSISDASWYELIRQLEYKSKWNNRVFYQIDTYYPSSQECSVCGSKNKNIKNLQIRSWECSECHSNHNRDINAASNIMFEGIKKYISSVA